MVDGPPVVVWNTTSSAPLGFWLIERHASLGRGDWAVIQPDPRTAHWLADRRYLRVGALLIKSVAAVEGQTICRQSHVVTVDGKPAAFALEADRWRRALPMWAGCRTLRPGELFLINADPYSLDGRYLGVTRVRQVVGRATLIWSP
jgi:type IV secretory pathway protease TraF